jgi:hypothetical protein
MHQVLTDRYERELQQRRERRPTEPLPPLRGLPLLLRRVPLRAFRRSRRAGDPGSQGA